jgi:hypothetical protein
MSKITNIYNLPDAMVRALESDYEYKDKRYSVTTVLAPLRETLLKRRYHDKIETDASDLIWALWGTGIHKALEVSAKNGELLEQGLGADIINGYRLTGYADMIDLNRNMVVDYKSSSVWQYINGDFDKYKQQLQMYSYLYYKMTGVFLDKGQIVMFMRDFSKMRAKNEKGNYPERPVMTINFDLGSPEEIEAYIVERFELLIKYENAMDHELPLCTPKERFNSGDKYAIMQKGKKRAVKLHDTLDLANAHLEYLQKTGEDVYSIEVRKGTDTKCLEYCSVNMFCDYYKENYENN